MLLVKDYLLDVRMLLCRHDTPLINTEIILSQLRRKSLFLLAFLPQTPSCVLPRCAEQVCSLNHHCSHLLIGALPLIKAYSFWPVWVFEMGHSLSSRCRLVKLVFFFFPLKTSFHLVCLFSGASSLQSLTTVLLATDRNLLNSYALWLLSVQQYRTKGACRL